MQCKFEFPRLSLSIIKDLDPAACGHVTKQALCVYVCVCAIVYDHEGVYIMCVLCDCVRVSVCVPLALCLPPLHF